jgi:hypothetical protein
MRCPACGNEIYKRIDYALVQCTRCGALWDAFIYPGFPVPNVDTGAIWDTSEPLDDDLTDDENCHDDDFDEPVDEEEDREKDEFYNWDVDVEADERLIENNRMTQIVKRILNLVFMLTSLIT